MSIGGSQPPYRTPCGYDEDAPGFWLGGPWQHYRSAESNIEMYQNTTTVPDYSLWTDCSEEGTGGAIPPYMRPAGGGISESTGCGCGNSPASASDTPCGAWPEPVPVNTNAPYGPAEYLNLSSCRKVGYKYVVARKAWHGRFGFTDPDGCCTVDGPAPQPPANTPAATTKYRTLAWDITLSYAVDTPGVYETGSYTLQGTVTINQYSGVATLTGATASKTVTETPYPTGSPTTTTTDLSSGDDAIADALLDACAPFCLTLGSSSTTVAAYADGILNDLLPYSNDGGALHTGISNTDYSVTYTAPEFTDGNGYTNSCSYSLSSSLSDPYTSDQVNADIDTLLAQWFLSNDVQLPFRTDAYCTSGPLVTYFEYGPNSPSPEYPGFTDSSPCDGSILGAPNSVAVNGYFDFRHLVYGDIVTDDATCSGVIGYGEAAPDWAGYYATQWTTDLDAAAYFPGAFAAYNTLQIGAGFCNAGNQFMTGWLHRSKYAEVLLLGAPSHNFARPCGPKDAETIDQTSITCSTSPPSGTLLFPDCANPCAASDWLDNYPKGDWCLVTWSFDYRDNPSVNYPVTGAWNGLTCSQECSTFVPCCPAVVFLSNNDESSTNSQTFTIPALACDECYGAQWQQMPMQWMTDPLYQPPQHPCDEPGSEGTPWADGDQWIEDDGSGHGDVAPKYYYSQRPWEEARASFPAGAPENFAADLLCCGVTITDLNTGTPQPLNTPSPPVAGQCWVPWWTWAINRANTIAASGNFSCDYADPMAVCADDIEIEPP